LIAIDVSNDLSSEDLRYLEPSDLESLTGIPASYWRAWGKTRKISERSLAKAAQALSLPMAVVLDGLNLKRTDVAKTRAAREKAARLVQQRRQERYDCPA
jgi:hypothetical protein